MDAHYYCEIALIDFGSRVLSAGGRSVTSCRSQAQKTLVALSPIRFAKSGCRRKSAQ